MPKLELAAELQTALKTVYEDCKQEDIAVRERQLRMWRRLKLLWEGYQRVWYSEVAHDWRIWDETADEDSDQAYYDKPINIFSAYLESIIAALSITVPPIKCYPDDADNTLDLSTAKAGDKICQLLQRHNEVSLLWLHALFVFVTEGMFACYLKEVTDENFGMYSQYIEDEVEEHHDITTCSNCGYTISDEVVNPNTPPPQNPPQQNPQNQGPQNNQNQPEESDEELKLQELDEFDPGDDDIKLHDALASGQDICPACMQLMDPELRRDKFIVTRLVGATREPKSRVIMEVYGGLYVKVPCYARCQEEIPYLVYSYERDYSLVVEMYDNLKGEAGENLRKQIKGAKGSNAGGYDQYEQWARLSPQYQGEYPMNVVTVNHAWIRPAKFNILNDEEIIKKLKQKFPDGCKVTFVNDTYAEACNESLDDHWTISYNPLSDYIHFDPLGQRMVSPQEITNDLISLVLQTIEHGIGQTFADPGVLNFNAYKQTEALPGGIFPATPKSGKTLQDGFHEIKTAQLSAEVLPFAQNIQTLGQMSSGALPSLFGGQLENNDTASGYSMSRAQALQRQQNTWKILTNWWQKCFGKAVPMYIKIVNMQGDERDVIRDNDGNFINTFVRKSELEGKIGKIELEANENLPMTWGQTRDTLMKLLEMQTPQVQELINAPENRTLVHDMLGLVDFYVPGEDDIIKQYDEIKQLLNSTPLPNPQPAMPGMPPPPPLPSVDIDPDYDNHQVEFEICRKWIVSEAGRQTKLDNPDGYMNVLLHGKQHLQLLQQRQQQVAPPEIPKVAFSFKGEDLADDQVRAVFDKIEQLPPPTMQQQIAAKVRKGAASPKKPNPLHQEAPITGEPNVPTVQ